MFLIIIGTIVIVIAVTKSKNKSDGLVKIITTDPIVSSTTTTEVTTTEPITTTETATTTEKAKTTTIKPTKENSTSISANGYKIETIDGITYVDGVLIANKTYSLPSDYNPGGLTKECKAAFDEMAAVAKEEGLTLFVCSGYRSYSKQKTIYEKYCNRDGKNAADRYFARPGHSEHQTGLAIDVNTASSNDNTSESFKPIREWIANNCYKYGFIVRYPEGKESITGYKYECWHIRYIGKDLAKKIYDSGLTLEEYYGITSKYVD